MEKRKLRPIQQEATKTLLKEKERWRDQVIFDHQLSGLTKAVAYAMANWITSRDTIDQYLRAKDIVISGTQRTLAEMVGCSAKTVHLATTSLIESGHIVLLRRPQGRMDSNKYSVIVKSQSVDANAAWVRTGREERKPILQNDGQRVDEACATV